MDSNTLDLNTLLTSETFFNKYELWMASNGDGRSLISEIQVYNSGNLEQLPVTIWRQGDNVLGIEPEFVEGPKQEGEEGNLIGLGDFDAADTADF